MTPGPSVRSSELSSGRALGRRLLVTGAALLMLVGGVAGGWWWLSAPPTPAPVAERPASSVPAVPRLDQSELASNGGSVTIPVRDARRIEVSTPPKHGSATVRGTVLQYRPKAAHIGSDAVAMSACNDGGCVDLTATVRTGRPGMSALTSVKQMGLIRRADQPLRPGTRISGTLPSGTTAVAVSVTVHDAARPGAVVVDAGAGRITAARAAAAGATTTNLVFLPVRRQELVVIDKPGGGLTVDVVGTFTASQEARSGRFVPVRQTRVAELDTARDGRDATIEARDYGAQPGVRAALVLVTATIGTQNAWVDFGRRPKGVDQTMTWGPSKSGRERRSVALVPLSARGAFSLNYQHGSTISVDVLGYFTGNRDASSVKGLYVPLKPSTLFNGVARHGGRDVDAPPPASTVAVVLAGTGKATGDLMARDVGIAANRIIGTVLPVERGRTTIRAKEPLQVRVDLVGYFVD